MNYDFIKEKLATEEYNFLRTEERLKKNIILLTLGGSFSYGTNIDTLTHTSDIDLRGIHLNSRKEILTMDCISTPFEDRATDSVIYPLKQIITLLTSCNPNTLEILGTKEEQLFVCTKEGKLLRDNAHIFLSKKVYASFGGYAIQRATC